MAWRESGSFPACPLAQPHVAFHCERQPWRSRRRWGMVGNQSWGVALAARLGRVKLRFISHFDKKIRMKNS
jgi:hypothetical protein